MTVTVQSQKIFLGPVTLSRNNSDPVVVEATYRHEVVLQGGSAGTRREGEQITFKPNIPPATQNTLNQLWDQLFALCENREGI
jgi:hypothetical protein